MTKIKQFFKGFSTGFLVAVLLVVGGFAIAQITVNIYEDSNTVEVIDDETAGAVTTIQYVPDYKNGFQVNSEDVIDGDNINFYNIVVDGRFEGFATSTPDDGGTGTAQNGYAAVTVAYWTNPSTEKDLIIEDITLDIYDEFNLSSSFSVATTTSNGAMTVYPYNQWRNATSGDATVIASTTISSSFDSKKQADGFISTKTHPGSIMVKNGESGVASSTRFVLGPSGSLVVSWIPWGYASSGAFTIAGGFTGDMTLRAKAYYREN